MRKIKMMTSAVLLSLSLAFSLTACGTKSEPAADTTAAEAEVTETEVEAETAEEAANDEEEKVKVGVSWNADEIDEDAQLYIDAVRFSATTLQAMNFCKSIPPAAKILIRATTAKSQTKN